MPPHLSIADLREREDKPALSFSAVLWLSAETSAPLPENTPPVFTRPRQIPGYKQPRR